jgi:hypothetical protein
VSQSTVDSFEKKSSGASITHVSLGVLHHDIGQMSDVTTPEWHPDKQIALERNSSHLEKDTIVSESLRKVFLVEGYNVLESRNAYNPPNKNSDFPSAFTDKKISKSPKNMAMKQIIQMVVTAKLYPIYSADVSRKMRVVRIKEKSGCLCPPRRSCN